MSIWPSDAEKWLASVDTQAKVGHRHHVVPRFLLQRWANSRGHLSVFSRADGTYTQRAPGDVAFKDFYTFIATDGKSNSTYEDFLAKIEEQVAPTIKWLLSPYRRLDQPLTVDQRSDIDLFVAFQFVRGPRARREMEQLADYYGKSMAQGLVPDDQLAMLEFVPHQNEHIEGMGARAAKIFELLHSRPTHLVQLDQPLLWVSDEPVVIANGSQTEGHHPDCFLTAKQLRKRAKSADTEFSTVGHIRTVRRTGLISANSITIPISPRVAFVYTTRGSLLGDQKLAGQSAFDYASNLNLEIAANALDTIVAPLSIESFRDHTIPPPSPILEVCGPASVAKHAANRTPARTRPRRYTTDI